MLCVHAAGLPARRQGSGLCCRVADRDRQALIADEAGILLQGFLRACRDSGLCTKVVNRINEVVKALKTGAVMCACWSQVRRDMAATACVSLGSDNSH